MMRAPLLLSLCLIIACSTLMCGTASAGRMGWLRDTADSLDRMASDVVQSVTVMASEPVKVTTRKILAASKPEQKPAPKATKPASPPKRSVSIVSLTSSSLISKPKCGYFLQGPITKPAGDVCYDQENHQKRHNLVYVVSRQGYQRPTTYCVPQMCTIKGSPFGKPGNKLVSVKENLYAVNGPTGKPKGPNSVISMAQNVQMTQDSQLVLQNKAHAILVGSALSFRSAWLDILSSILTALQTRITGTMNMLQVAAGGQLKVVNSLLSLTNTKAWIYGSSRMLVRNSTATFTVTGSQKQAVDPIPFMFSGSTLDVQQGSLAFVGHDDVYFSDSYIRLNGSVLSATKSNIRFFDSVIDMRNSRFVATQSKIWLFNTTLVRDKRVVKVGGTVPVKLGDVLGKKAINAKVATGTVQVTNL